MKRVLLILGFILAYPIVLSAGELNQPKATINIGIYYTVGLNNFIDVENLIQETEGTINSFFPRKIIDVNIVFLEYWSMPELSANTENVFAMFEGVNKPATDVYLILTDAELFYEYKEIGYPVGGMVNNFGGNKIILGNIANVLAAQDGFIKILLLHELGHKFGMRHSDEESCERKMMLMCFKSALSTEVVVDKTFIKALYYYYETRKR